MKAPRVAFVSAIWIAAMWGALPEARAASFDCATATSAQEQAICQSPALSAMDDKIAAAYRTAEARLSPAGREILKEHQSQWHSAIDAGCSGLSQDPMRLAACLDVPYRFRLDDLSGAVQVIGPFTFLRGTFYNFVPCVDSFGCGDGYRDGGYVHAARPIIDQPATEETGRWNRLVAGKMPPLAGALQPNAKVTLTYKVVGVSEDMISAHFTLSEYRHRAAQPSLFVYGLNTILTSGKQIGADDLFADGSGWQEFVYRQTIRQLRRGLSSQDGQIMPGVIADLVTRPERWTITPDGFGVLFAPLDLGLGVVVLPKTVIPWADLKPYLRAPSLFRLPQ
jgi:uncharacterized protein YecT (DUF1311 family)